MSKLLDEYQVLRNKIIERALYINNMLYDLELPDKLGCHRPEYCNVCVEALMRYSTITVHSVNLIYPEPYEDYDNSWVITANYIGMDDKDIIDDFIKRINTQYDIDKHQKLEILKRDAAWLGYDLVEKK